MAAVLLIGAALVLVAHRIAKPIEAVADAAERIADGDLEVEIASSRGDEVGRMARAFARMVAGLRGQAEVAIAIERVEASAEAMGAELADFVAVAESSSASTEQVSASAQQTSASTQEIAASAQDLAAQAKRLEALVGHFTL